MISMRCFFHPEQEAVGTCSECSKGICKVCKNEVGNLLYCSDFLTSMVKEKERVSRVPDLKLKDPSSAAAMSLLHGGLGQFYNGEILKGVLLLGSKVAVLAVCLGLMIAQHFAVAIVLFLLCWASLWLYGIFDAYFSARSFNERVAPGKTGVEIDGVSEYQGSSSKKKNRKKDHE